MHWPAMHDTGSSCFSVALLHYISHCLTLLRAVDPFTALLHYSGISGGALAKPASGKPLSTTARAGSHPRSAACAGCARAGHSSRCTWSIHIIHTNGCNSFSTTCWAGDGEPQGGWLPGRKTPYGADN